MITSVAGLDVERHQRQQQRVGARRHGDRVADAEQRRELLLERVDLGAHDEALAVGHAGHRGENLVADRPMLRLEIEQRNLHRQHSTPTAIGFGCPAITLPAV